MLRPLASSRLIVPVLFSAAFALAAPKLTLEELPRMPEAVVDAASSEGMDAMNQFVLPPDMTAELWAAEPMLANPVAFSMDYQGKVYVAETYRYGSSVLDIRGYMPMLEVDLASRTIEDRTRLIENIFGDDAPKFGIESERVRLIEDRDGDGRADHAIWYAEGFNAPLDGILSGVLPYKGDVFVTSIPSLWRLGDPDATGVATRREELLRGFGVHFGYTGHDLHGLIIGPDGKLYFSVGDRGTNVPTKEGGRIYAPDMGAVFRCNLDGTEFELYAWGLRNPQELAFDEFGNLFTFDNDCDNGDRERLVQVVQNGDSGWRIGYQYAPLGKAGPWMLEERWKPRFEGQPQDFLPPITNIQDGPSGVAYYPGTGLNPRYAQTFFVAQFKGSITRSGIATYRLKPAGASFELAETGTFLSGALATDVQFGPDGKLYYSDWVKAWPKSSRGRIYAISDPSRTDDPLVAQTQKILRTGMTGRTGDELGQLLGHADQRVRLEAQWELAGRGPESLPLFALIANDTRAALLARVHALWGLGQLAAAKHAAALAPIRHLLTAPEAELRAQAAKLLGDHGVAEAVPALIGALQDESNRVKFFAAQSLGLLKAAAAAPALIEVLRANADADLYLRHAAIMGLVGGANREALASTVTDASPAVRLGGLLAYRRLRDPEVRRFLHDRDPAIVAEAAQAINDDAIDEARPALAALLGSTEADDMTTLRVLNATFREGHAANARALASYAANTAIAPEHRGEALSHLAAWANPPARDRIVGVHRPLSGGHSPTDATASLSPLIDALLQDDSGLVQAETLKAMGKLDLRTHNAALLRLLADESRDHEPRIAALKALRTFDDPQLAEAVRIAGLSGDSEVRLAALPMLAQLSPGEALAIFRRMLDGGDARELRAVYAALQEVPGTEPVAMYLDALQRLSQGLVPIAAQLELLEAAAARTEPEIVAALAARDASLTASDDLIAPFRMALDGGDLRAGGRVFNDHPVLACVRCHMVRGVGGAAGPDLSAIGTKEPNYILTSIIAPNAAIAEGFNSVMLTLKDGLIVAGTLKEQSATTITLALGDGSTKTVPLADVKERSSAPSSMPPIYGSVLTKHELRDLMAYLTSLHPAAPGASSVHGEGDEAP